MILINYMKELNRISSNHSMIFIQIPDCLYYQSLNQEYTFVSAIKLMSYLEEFELAIDYNISSVAPIIVGTKIKKN